MKVLFAMRKDSVSKSISDMYYERYGEVLEYKNVFFFKALIEEVKNNKTYDRIVIDEDLEEYRSNDMQQLDRVLFNNIDKITDEISDADIILVCTDRREKGDQVINQLFSMGIYNLLLGNDRNINPLCDIIRKPRTKKEAKDYLKIDTSLMTSNSMTRDEEVDEGQMISIIKYYEGIKNQPDKYLETFDKIAKQYSRIQLKIIVSYLPKEVRDVILKADRYKYLDANESPFPNDIANEMTSTSRPSQQNSNDTKSSKKENGGFWPFGKKKGKDSSSNADGSSKFSGSVNTKSNYEINNINDEQKRAEVLDKAKAELAAQRRAEQVHAENQAELARRAKAEAERREQVEREARAKAEAERREQAALAEKARMEAEQREQATLAERARIEAEKRQQAELEAKARAEVAKREQEAAEAKVRAEAEKKKQNNIIVEVKPNPNSPANSSVAQSANTVQPASGTTQFSNTMQSASITQTTKTVQPTSAGKQPNSINPTTSFQASGPVNNPVSSQESVISNLNSVTSSRTITDQMSNPEEKERLMLEQEKLALEQKKIREAQEKIEEERRKLREEQERLANEQNKIRDSFNEYTSVPQYTNNVQSMRNVSGNVNKMVVFVGANKSGTTFVTNAVAHSLASSKIRTSILDMTRDKSMFYLYNQNDKGMRKRAAECMQRLADGEDMYLETNSSYLKVYTTVPGSVSDVRRGFKHKSIIETVKANCNVTIVDADFTTPIDYFDQADAIFIVHDLDLLKMPDTTLFLRELKNRGMNMKKIKIIINKYVKTSLTPKNIMQALSYYSDPAMSFVDELLPSRVDYSIIPYNLNNYAKYIDCVCHGVINYKGYSADFLQAISEIADIVYTKDSSKRSSKKLFG